MGFCENIGEQVIIKGQNSDRKAFICKAGAGQQQVLASDGTPVNVCPFSSILSAIECSSYMEVGSAATINATSTEAKSD